MLQRAISGAAILAVGPALAACGSVKSAAPNPAHPPQSLIFQPYPYGYPDINTAFKLMEQVLEPFEKQNNVDIKLVLFNTDADNVSAIIGGDGPDIIYGTQYGPYLSQNLLMNLSPLLQQDGISTSIWSKGQVEYFQRPNGTFAIPGTIETFVYLLNLSDFDRAGISYPGTDWTLEEFLTSAQALANPSKQHFGTNFAMQWDDVEGYQWFFEAFGGSINNAQGTTCTLNTSPCIQAGNWLYEQLIWPKLGVTRNSARLGGKWDAKQLAAGDVSMSVLAPIQILTVVLTLPSEINWTMYPFPTFPAGKMNWASAGFFAINRETKHSNLAWEFLKYVTVGTDWQRAMIQMNFLGPIRTDLWPEWKATAEELAPSLKNKGLQYYLDAVEQGYAVPGTFFDSNDSHTASALDTTFAALASRQQTDVAAAFSAVQNQIRAIESGAPSTAPTAGSAQAG